MKKVFSIIGLTLFMFSGCTNANQTPSFLGLYDNGDNNISINVVKIEANTSVVEFIGHTANTRFLFGQDNKTIVNCKYDTNTKTISGNVLENFTIKQIENDKIELIWGKDKIIIKRSTKK